MTNPKVQKSLASLLAGPVFTVGLAEGREAVRAALGEYAARAGLFGVSPPARATEELSAEASPAVPEGPKHQLPEGLTDDDRALLEDPELASQFRAKLRELTITERQRVEDRRHSDEFWASADARSKVDEIAERIARELAAKG